jgi:hypothetical protein
MTYIYVYIHIKNMDYGIKIVMAITFAVCVAFCCIHMCDRALYANHINRTKVIPTGVIIIESGTERVNNEKITYVKII